MKDENKTKKQLIAELAELRKRVSKLEKTETRRKKNELILREIKERYQTLAEQSLVGTYIVNDKEFIYQNEAGAKMFGYRPDEIVGKKKPLDLVHPDDRSKVAENIKKRLSRKTKELRYTFRGLHKKGKTIECEVFGRQIMFQGKPALLGTCLDITQREKSKVAVKQALRLTEFENAKSEAIVSSIGDAVCILDPDFKILYENPVHIHQYGDHVGEYCYRAFQKREEVCDDCPVAMSYKDGQTHTHQKSVHTEKGHIWIEITASPLRDEKGKIIAGIEVIRDISDRKSTEDALRQSQAQLQTVIESLPFDFFGLKDDGRYFIQNSALRRNWGNIIGKQPQDFAPDEKTLLVWLDNNKKAFHGEVVKGDVAFPVKGEQKFFHNIIAPIRENDCISGIIGVNIDITDRVKSEKALAYESYLMNTLLDHHTDFIYFKDTKGRFQRVSKRFCNLFGRGVEEIIGKTDLELFPEEVAKETHKEDLAVIETGTPLKGKEEYANGTWVLTTKLPWHDKEGNIIGLFGISHDITERKKAEEALRNSEQKYRTLFETMAQGVVYQDSNGKITAANPAAECILGLTMDQMLGRTSMDPRWRATHENGSNFPGEDHPAMVSLNTGKSVRDVVMGVFDPILEEYRWINIDAIPQFRYGEKKPYQVYTTFTDITERKRSEDEMRLFSVTIEEAPDGIQIVDLNGHITYSNRAVENMYGYSREELKGRHVNEMNVDPTFAEKVILPSIRNTGSWVGELVVKKKNGEKFPIWLTTSLVRDKKGNPIAMVGIIRDITRQKQEEERIRLFSSAVENASDGVVFTDMDSIISYVNDKAVELYGYTREELIGKLVYVLDPDPEISKDIDREAIAKDGWSGEILQEKKNGHTFPAFLSISIIKDDDGKPTGMMGIVRDITEPKRTEQILKQSEEKYRNLSETLNQVIYRADPRTWGATYVNKAIKEIYGYTVTEWLEDITLWQNSIHPDDRKRVFDEITESHKKLKNTIIAYRIIARNRSVRWVEDHISWERDQYGKVISLNGILYDITERKQAENQIKDSLREKEVLVRELHHRVKNNLQVITSMLNLQSRHFSERKILDMFQESQHRIRSMALIHEKLYMSENLSHINIGGYIRDLAAELFRSYGMGAKRVILTIECEDITLGVDIAIPCGLIINELISNSLKHAFPGNLKGQLIVKLNTVDSERYELTVSDNGVGLPEKLDYRKTESLGLHLVTMLTESQLHGNIELNREKGTQFLIRF